MPLVRWGSCSVTTSTSVSTRRTLISVGYELQEFDPARMDLAGDKRILHLSRFPAEVDASYDVEVGVQADLSATLDALAAATSRRWQPGASGEKIRALLAGELARGAADDSFPLKPQRIVSDRRAACSSGAPTSSWPIPAR